VTVHLAQIIAELGQGAGLPPARDLKPAQPKDHAEPPQRATELKRMPTALIQKLNADR
jgi:hypothetical protein